MELKDRQSTHPGRIILKDVQSGEEKTYDVILADDATVQGSPLNKQTLTALKQDILKDAADKIKPSVNYTTIVVSSVKSDIY